jgi:hypothetical protein
MQNICASRKSLTSIHSGFSKLHRSVIIQENGVLWACLSGKSTTKAALSRVYYCRSKKKSPDSNNRALLLNEASIFYLAMVILAAVLKFLP